jgi:dTMP kinase
MIIVIEGIDGSGKSTLAQKLFKYLKNKNYRTKLILSRSFHDYEHEKGIDIFSSAKNLKSDHKLQALSYSLWHAADFAYRFETEMKNELQDTVFIMDRYIYTPIIRDSIRGVELHYIKNVYSFAPNPDFIFNLQLPTKIALGRVISRGGKPGFYESGTDYLGGESLEDNFITYQDECTTKYAEILPKEQSYIIDAMKSSDDMTKEIIDIFESKANNFSDVIKM